MRKIGVALGVIAALGLSASLLKAGEEYVVPGSTSVSIVDGNGQPVAQPQADECDCASAECCPRCGKICKMKAYFGSFSCFNCNCKGSYKFPVPPQYTYHWPGMYSQQTMLEHVSPYRFPPLNLPPDMVPPGGKVPPAPPHNKVGHNKTKASQASLVRDGLQFPANSR
jgi:hypothetical protein